MEWSTEVNFKFTDDKIHDEVSKIFKSMHEKGEFPESELKDKFFQIFPNNESEINKYFGDTSYTELFEAVETVSANPKIIKIVSLCGSGVEEIVPKFMKFLASIGGKPLASKSFGDESSITFKYLKSGGVDITVKDDDDDEG